MAIAEISTDLIGSLGKIGLYLQAAGIIILIWIGVQTTNLIINYKSKKRIARIEKKLDILTKKIDSISKKNKN